MASAVIHLAVANEINKNLKKNNDCILIGSIAPDIAKHIGESRNKSHFLDNNNLPNLDKFLVKYKDKLGDDFVLGYFIHLYTDYLWFKYFVPEIYDKNMITRLDDTCVSCDDNLFRQYVYNDYTNLNVMLLDAYNMDLNIFYNEPPKFENIIEEIPMNDIKLIIDETSVIIENSKETKAYVFDIENIKKFISTSTSMILSRLEEIL